MKAPARPYHHGNLRRALLDAAVAAIARDGVSALSLRGLAREVGVSHAAPVHHFGDKRGLLTAVAAEGFERLAAALESAWAETRSFLEVGVAYVRFATEHPAHFEVMFRPDLYDREDPSVATAAAAAAGVLYDRVGTAARRTRKRRETDEAAVAAWALVHGLATLWLNGALPRDAAGDPADLARRTASYLFGR